MIQMLAVGEKVLRGVRIIYVLTSTVLAATPAIPLLSVALIRSL